MKTGAELRERLKKAVVAALVVAGAGATACAIGAVVDPAQAARSWLWAFLFWTGLAVGCAGAGWLHQLLGGGWGALVRRLLESGAATAPLLPLLFLPLLPALSTLYPWVHPVHHAGTMEAKAAYLNVPFFLVRTGLYFATWIAGGVLLAREAAKPDREARRRLRRWSGPGLLVYGFTLSFAAVDWAMSLEPLWFSSVYGLLFIAGQLLSTFALVAVAAGLLRAYDPFRTETSPQRSQDLGNLLFMSVLLWAYLSFSQFLLIWSANLPEEVPWILSRVYTSWGGVAAVVLLLHFAVPFLLLLRADLKRNPAALAAVAGLLLVLRLVDTYWWVAPAFFPGGARVHWLDGAATAAVGGAWIAAWLFLLRRRPADPEAAHV